jgi:hypothetical protein
MDTVGMGPRLLLSLSYATEGEAEKAHALVEAAIKNAIHMATV